MWFVRPTTLVFLAPALHVALGAAVGAPGRYAPSVRPVLVVSVAVAINAAATALPNAYGAGVMGVGWWAIGSVLSLVLMLVGLTPIGRVLRRAEAVASLWRRNRRGD